MEAADHLGAIALYPRSAYVHLLKPELPADAFAPARSRLLLVPFYLAVIAVGIASLGLGWVPLLFAPLVSLAIGAGFAGLTFVAHEALHGAIVTGRTRRLIVGWLAFMPFALSPRLWVAWHNRAHHGHSNEEGDPDGYATLERYRARRGTRFSVDMFSLGGRRWRGALSLVLGFTVQSFDQLFGLHARGLMTRREQVLAYAETGLALAVWGTVAYLVGFVPFLFVWVLPLLIGNACVMAFILTNHALSPRVPIDDPLVNSLSVTTPRLIDRLTLRFGLHVEHHLFPAMSSRHAPAVRTLLKQRFPGRYQSMSLRRALLRLHRTARVYKDSTTLLDPKTGREYPTLLPTG
ncbi:MAG: fatty acid desaturase family protein [Acidobacteriota bacterium]